MVGIFHSMKPKERGTELCEAVLKGDAEKVEALLREGADVNAMGGKNIHSVAGLTPLWRAVSLAGKEISSDWREFREALTQFAPETPNWNHEAKRARLVGLVKMLIANGANLEIHCRGRTPLAIAVCGSDLELVVLLLANHADPNAKTYSIFSKAAIHQKRKTTPGYYNSVLHEAVEKNLPQIVRTLVSSGADTSLKDHEGKLPSDIASEKGFAEVLQALSKA